MKLPAQLKTMLSSIVKGMGKSMPPGIDVALESDWDKPIRATTIDYTLTGTKVLYPDVASVYCKGITPEGATIRILIQVEGLREIPDSLREFMGGPDA